MFYDFVYWPYALALILLTVGALSYRWWRLRSLEEGSLRAMKSWETSWTRLGIWHTGFLLLGICLAVALLGPGGGMTPDKSARRGLDVFFILDVSNSMKALDLASSQDPGRSRLDVAKRSIQEFLKARSGDRVGLIVFAGESIVVTPLTHDIPLFQTYLDQVSTEDVRLGGTNFTESLAQGIERLSTDPQNPQPRALILISDGEETIDSGIALQAKRARDQDIPILVVGIGTEEGAPVPEGLDPFGVIRYKTYQGERVISRLNTETLKEIARISGGRYAPLSDQDSFEVLIKQFENLPRVLSWEQAPKQTRSPNYEPWLWGALLGFLIVLFVREGRSRYPTRLGIWFLMIFFLSGCQWHDDLWFRYHNHQGVEAFLAGEMGVASERFKASREWTENQLIPDNQEGLIAAQEADYEKAKDIWHRAVEAWCEDDPQKPCDQVYYHLGNALYRLSETEECFEDKKPLLEDAFRAYESAQAVNPNDNDIVDNRNFIEGVLADPPEDQCQNGNDGDKEGENEGGDDESEQDQDQGSGEQDQDQSEDQGGGEDQSESENENSEGGSEGDSESDKDQGSEGQDQDQEQDQSQDREGGGNESESGGSGLGEQGQASEPGQKPSSESSPPADPYAIPPDIQAKIDAYERQMQSVQDRMADQFRRRADQTQQGGGAHPFSGDPFFEDFFEDTPFKHLFDEFLGVPVNQGEGSAVPKVEKDW